MSDFTNVPYTEVMEQLNVSEAQLTPEITAKITEFKKCLTPPRKKGYQQTQAIINNEIVDILCELEFEAEENNLEEKGIDNPEELKEEVIEHIKKGRTGIFLIDYLNL